MNKKNIVNTIIFAAIVLGGLLILGWPAARIVGLGTKDKQAVIKDLSKQASDLKISGENGSSFDIPLPKGTVKEKLVIGLFDSKSKKDFGEALDLANRFVDDNPSFTAIQVKDKFQKSKFMLVLKAGKIGDKQVRYWTVASDGTAAAVEIKTPKDDSDAAKKISSQGSSAKRIWGPGVEFYNAAAEQVSKLNGIHVFSEAAAELSSLIVMPVAPIDFEFAKDSDGVEVLRGTLTKEVLDTQNLFVALGSAPKARKSARKVSIRSASGVSFVGGVGFKLDVAASGFETRVETDPCNNTYDGKVNEELGCPFQTVPYNMCKNGRAGKGKKIKPASGRTCESVCDACRPNQDDNNYEKVEINNWCLAGCDNGSSSSVTSLSSSSSSVASSVESSLSSESVSSESS